MYRKNSKTQAIYEIVNDLGEGEWQKLYNGDFGMSLSSIRQCVSRISMDTGMLFRTHKEGEGLIIHLIKVASDARQNPRS